ncbi:hypothetical protein BGZ60DRAFT_387671 [Tricladium varicosporioides]|nr:hypothetical protein BGZ60DRAFT_387671 [Hymenoscyphus varicosporioides]
MPSNITWNKDRPAGTIEPAFRYPLASDPSLTVVGLKVTFPPNASTPPHNHGTANVIAYVVSGSVVSAMNSGEAKTYQAGETCDNASTTEEAVLLGTFVIKTEVLEKEGLSVLVNIEPEYLEGAMEQFSRGGGFVGV